MPVGTAAARVSRQLASVLLSCRGAPADGKMSTGSPASAASYEIPESVMQQRGDAIASSLAARQRDMIRMSMLDQHRQQSLSALPVGNAGLSALAPLPSRAHGLPYAGAASRGVRREPRDAAGLLQRADAVLAQRGRPSPHRHAPEAALLAPVTPAVQHAPLPAPHPVQAAPQHSLPPAATAA
ncbi:unnamed protein product, partial [Symbiodinium sp. KB8]